MQSPQEIADRWANNLSAAGAKIKAGVQATTENPMAKAAAQKGAYVAGVQRAADRWAAKLASTPIDVWRQGMLGKGLQNIATGANAAKGKMATFLSKFLPFVQQARQSIASMPRGTYEQNKARANAMMDALHQFNNS